MKKIMLIALMAVAFNSQAFWNGNSSPWGGNNNMPWGNFVEDNGIFGFNPYEYTNPQWYSTEMGNMFDEFDDSFGNNNNYPTYGNQYRNPYMNQDNQKIQFNNPI